MIRAPALDPSTLLMAAATLDPFPPLPHVMSIFPAQNALRTVKLVREQMTIVSIKTSNMPYSPCLTGSVSDVAACAIGAEPRPASLEKQPRPMPFLMPVMMPILAPTAALGLKAPLKIRAKTDPRYRKLQRMTLSVATI